MRLLTRFSLANLLVMLAIFLATSLIIYHFTQVILVREMKADLDGVEANIVLFIKQHDSFPTGFSLDEEKISIISTGHQKVPRSSGVISQFSQRENKMHNFMKLDFPVWYKNSWYKISVSKPLEGMHHLSNALINISISSVLIIILISIALNGFLLKRLWRPFYQSMEIMKGFKLGESDIVYFPKTAIAEFAFMNENLLAATNTARKEYRMLKEFTENASHEMQTPLSIIRSKLDMLIQDKELSRHQSELAREAYAAIKRLSRLNYSLLLLAKIENQQFDNVQRLNLKEKISKKIEQFQELWLNNEFTISCSLEDSYLNISPELLDILLNNLLSNAGNHNRQSGFISVNLTPFSLIVSNSGSPKPLDQEKLFTRFYKTVINSNHNGLGLSIIKQISDVSSIEVFYQYVDEKHAFILKWE